MGTLHPPLDNHVHHVTLLFGRGFPQSFHQHHNPPAASLEQEHPWVLLDNRFPCAQHPNYSYVLGTVAISIAIIVALM
jgi:hypothetical protein